MSPNKITLTPRDLHRLFRYDPETGKLFWNKRGKGRKFGKEAGCFDSSGYRVIGVCGAVYPAHRVIWLMVYGEIRQDLEIDHINGIKDDNRIENLRLVTGQQNGFNRTTAKGYCENKGRGKKWKATIGVNGCGIHLGYFDKESEARNAYLEAKEKHHQIEPCQG